MVPMETLDISKHVNTIDWVEEAMKKRWIISVPPTLLREFQRKVREDWGGKVSEATIGRVFMDKYVKGEINVTQDEIEAHHGWANRVGQVDTLVKGDCDGR